MRGYEDYHKILELWEQGFNKKQIERMTYIPRGTVVDCIKRYGSLKGLEENKERASHSTPDKVLREIWDFQNALIQQAYAYTLGIYLGDGYIAKNKRVYYLRIALDTRYPNIIETCFQNIQILLPDNKVNVVHSTQGNSVEVVCTYKFWPDLLPQHGVGKKYTRKIKLEDWQKTIVEAYPLEFFRGFYHSDGSRFDNVVKGKAYPRYQFTNTSTDIINLFTRACDALGVHWTSKERVSQIGTHVCDIFISRRKDVEYLDTIVGPKT